MAEGYATIDRSLPPKEYFYSREMLISLQCKSREAHYVCIGDCHETRLTPLARLALPCLETEAIKRPTAQGLLQDPFLLRPTH